MARFVLSTPELRRGAFSVGRSAVDEFSRKVVNRARVLTPVDTGRLRASLRIQRGRTWRGPNATVGTDVEYAPAVHDGTGPHVIRPVRKKALAFKIGGRTVIVAKVNHPGTRPRPFLDRALREVARTEGWTYQR